MRFVKLLPNQLIRAGKIICVGRNYIEHIQEMEAERTKEPVLFLKPSTSILYESEPIVLPGFSKNVHHEVELALLVGAGGKNISAQSWKSHISGAGIALDLTLRDLQKTAKEKGLPWDVSKGFDGSCPLSAFKPLQQTGELDDLRIELKIDGQSRQNGNTSQMIFPPARLIEYISGIFTLEPGDIILTGTPSGVGPLASGNTITASIQNIGEIVFKVQ